MFDKIEKAIKELGEDPVASLRERDICGIRGDSAFCPIARYLQKELEFYDLDVDGDAVCYKDPYSGWWQEYDLPEHINQFVADFDEGRYPELEDVVI